MSTPRSVKNDPRVSEGVEQGNNAEPVKIFGVEIPLPLWARLIFGGLVLVFLAIAGVRHFQEDNKATDDSARQIKDLKQQIAGLVATGGEKDSRIRELIDDYAELSWHENKKDPTDWVDEHDSVIVRHYPSDGCVSVQHKHTGHQTRFVRDPGRVAQPPAPGAIDGGNDSQAPTPSHPSPTSEGNRLWPNGGLRAVAFNSLSSDPAPGAETAPKPAFSLYGRCLNPHPDAFQSSNGTTRGCWLQVWRVWGDGCTHYQWFNTCSNAWDADASGNPRVYWTKCFH